MSDEYDTLPPPRARRKPENVWGNIFEGITTYGFSFFIFLPVNAFLVFGPLHFETAEEKARFWPLWIFFALLFLAANLWAAFVGVQARFSSKAFRLFADYAASLSPLLLPLSMVLLGPIGGTYVADGLDVQIAIFNSLFAIADIGIAYLVHTAIRRVKEVTGEQ